MSAPSAARIAMRPEGYPRCFDILRVSSQQQDVERQRRAIQKVKDRFGGSTLETLALVGVSGTATLNNKDFQRILNKMSEPDNDGVRVANLDRLLRPKRYGSMELFDYFADNKKAIWSDYDGLVEPWTDEGYDKCMDAARQAGAQWRKIQSTAKDGRLEKRERGELPYMIAPPFGFIQVRKRFRVETKNRWVIAYYLERDTEEKQNLVRRIFRLSAREKMNDHAIARLLDREGIPSPRGKKWSQQTIALILENTAYIGYVLSGKGTPDEKRVPCPRILRDDSDWEIAQARPRRNYEQWCGRRTKLHQLSNYLWCAKPGCKGRLTGKCVGRGYRKYQCKHKDVVHGGAIKCEWLEDSVWMEVIVKQLGNSKTLSEALRDQHKPAGKQARGDHDQALAKKKRALDTNEKNLDDPEQEYRRAELKKMNRELRAEIATLEGERRSDNVLQMPTTKTVEALAAAIRLMASWKTYKQRRPVIEALIRRIDYWDREYTVEIDLPPDEVALSALGSDGSTCGSNRQVAHAELVNSTRTIPLKFKGKVRAA